MKNKNHLMLEEKWKPLLDKDKGWEQYDEHRQFVTLQLLENQEKQASDKTAVPAMLNEAAPENNYGDGNSNVKSWDPVLINMVRRAAPQMIAYDVCGVQPLTQPSGLVFALKARYGDGDANLTDDPEALFAEADTDFTGTGTHAGTDPAVLNKDPAGTYTEGTGMATANAEALGTAGGGAFASMGITIDKVSVQAVSRKVRADYSIELEQDMRSVHRLSAREELARILSTEIMSETNRETVRKIYRIAEIGAQTGTANAGTFDLDTDSNGRWLGERHKGLLFQLEKEANQIALRTRRGRGNIMIVTPDVASALDMAGKLDYTPALAGGLGDFSQSTFVGVLNGKFKVYVDPYITSSESDFACVGYKGTDQYDAGLFYCPYVPLQMLANSVDHGSLQPAIGFHSREGFVTNPFANASGNAGDIVANANKYYRKIRILNI